MKYLNKIFVSALLICIFNFANAAQYADLGCISELENFPTRSGDLEAFNEKYDKCKTSYDKAYSQLPTSASSDDFNLIEQYRRRLNVIDKNIRQDVAGANYSNLEHQRIAKNTAEAREKIENEKKRQLAYESYVEKWRKELKPGVRYESGDSSGFVIDVNHKTGLAKIEYQYCASVASVVSQAATRYAPILTSNVCASWATAERHIRISDLYPDSKNVPKDFLKH